MMVKNEKWMNTLKIIPEQKLKMSRIKNILAIAAGKGGVGKSTVSVNLALSLKEQGLKVGILDADIYGPSLLQMLPKGILPVQDPENEEAILPGLTLGLKMITTAHFRKNNEASIVRAPIANSIITQFLHQVHWGDLDVLIIDFPPGTGDIQLTLMQQAAITGGIMVTTPQEVALIDVRKCIEMFQKMQIPILGIIENMSFYKDPKTQEKHTPFGSGGAAKLSSEFSIPVLGEVPIDAELSRSGDSGQSIFISAPESGAAAIFHEIGQKVHSELNDLDAHLKKFTLEWKTGLSKCTAEPKSQRITSKEPVFISSISQRDDESFMIVWTDGSTTLHFLKDLQKQCPCAACQGSPTVHEQLSCIRISSIGQYALKISFTSGCSKGIYTYELLRKMAGVCG